jgi:hypothetical protein
MKPSFFNGMRLRGALLGAAAAALALGTTTALAGSGPGGIFNLGQANSVDAQTVLTGNPGANAQLRLVNGGLGAALRAESQSGIGVNGISVSGTGQFGQSQTGIGLQGIHIDAAGTNPGVEGKTNSTDPNGAGVVGRNTGGGPGVKAIVNAGAPPLAVNSQVKVANLNVDFLDGLDSSALQKRVTDGCNSGQAVRVVNADGTVSCEPVGLTGAWGLNGNGGATGFLGTTDANPLVLKTNNAERARLTEAGNVGIGTATPAAKLDVNAGSSADPVGVSIFGRIESTGFGGLSAAVEGENTSTSNIGMGVAGLHSGSGWGVYGAAPTGSGVVGRHTAATGAEAGVLGMTDSAGANAVGVLGQVNPAGSASDSAAVKGVNSGAGIGVSGQSASGYGVLGTGKYGVVGTSAAADGSAIWANNSGAGDGIYGGATTGRGVYGIHQSSTGTEPGLYGVTNSTSSNSAAIKGAGGPCGFCIGVLGTVPGNGIGVRGETPAGVSNAWGVEGIGSDNGIGVRGKAGNSGSGVVGVGGNGGSFTSSVANGTGVVGAVTGAGHGVRGQAGVGGVGVRGVAPAGGFAGQFAGEVDVQGYLRLKVSVNLPPASDCNEDSEAGRMTVQILQGGVGESSNDVWVCFGALSGWLRLRL